MSKIILFFSLFFAKIGLCQHVEASGLQKMNWSPNALSFKNYLVVDNYDSLPYNPYLANTNLNITYYYKLKKDSLIMFVENLFMQQGSWIKKEHVDDTTLLKHEQGHFNLSEIYSRKLASAFAAFHFTKNYKLEIKQVATMVLAEQRKQQELYDKESNSGENALVQKKWYNKIQNGLQVSKPTDGMRISVAITEK